MAVDGHDASKRALGEALDIAALAQGRLHAVYIIDPWGVLPYAGYSDPEALRNVLHEDGKITLEAALGDSRTWGGGRYRNRRNTEPGRR